MSEARTEFELSETASFAKYGKQFQEGIFQGLLTDTVWSAQMIEVMNPSFFDIKYLEFLCEKYFFCFPLKIGR